MVNPVANMITSNAMSSPERNEMNRMVHWVKQIVNPTFIRQDAFLGDSRDPIEIWGQIRP